MRARPWRENFVTGLNQLCKRDYPLGKAHAFPEVFLRGRGASHGEGSGAKGTPNQRLLPEQAPTDGAPLSLFSGVVELELVIVHH